MNIYTQSKIKRVLSLMIDDIVGYDLTITINILRGA